MRKNILLTLIAALAMTACAHGPTQTPTPMLNRPATQELPEKLPPPQSGATQDLLANHVLVAKAYHQCRDLYLGLTNWLTATDP